MDREQIKSIKKLDFRKDVNFLRAISVIAVIIYHLNKNFLPGGWLGVDIFFFISGYLISNKILIDLINDKFLFRNFYLKRIKRILPALTSSLLFTLPFAYFLLPPKELQIFLQSLLSSLLFYSNYFFGSLDFYNLPSTQFFPLLHMWSLSIEEQYYLLLPIILFLIFKLKKKIIFKSIFIFTLISLTLNIFNSTNLVFYQLHFRIWEFFLGVIFMFLENKLFFSKKSKNLGLLLILFSLYFFDDSLINFFYTRLICLIGVFIFLVKSKESRLINQLINNKILQHYGLISFSLYLFHQPLIVFFKIYDKKINNLSDSYFILLIVILYLVSFTNWKVIEYPFQYNFTKNKKIILSFTYLILILITASLLNEDSFINRYTSFPQKAILLSFKNQDITSQNGVSCNNRNVSELCEFNVSNPKFKLYVLGDSSLRTLSKALLEYQENNFDLIHFSSDDCLYLVGKKLSENSCPNNEVSELDKYISEIQNSIIIYGGRLPRYLSGKGFDNSYISEENDINVISEFETNLKNTILYLSSKNILILLYPIPEQGWNVPEQYFYNKVKWGDPIAYPSNIWNERVANSNRLLDSINSKNILRVYPDDLFCNTYILNQCVGAFESQIFYSDDDHLSLEGSRLLAKKIMEVLESQKLD